MTVLTRRIVTGHTADGRSIVIQDGPVPHIRAFPGARFDEAWATGQAPEALGLAPVAEPTTASLGIGPPPGGSTIRVIEFAPATEGGRRSPMHRTRTIDYGIVLEGEVVLILTDSEVVLKAGDVVIQRGTDHAWENRSGRHAMMAFVLIDAAFDPELDAMIESEIMP